MFRLVPKHTVESIARVLVAGLEDGSIALVAPAGIAVEGDASDVADNHNFLPSRAGALQKVVAPNEPTASEERTAFGRS